MLTSYQSQYVAWELTRRAAGDSMESLASTLVDAQVDLNPHQVEAALFACRNPLSKGVLLADEVGPGKTIEVGLVTTLAEEVGEGRSLLVCCSAFRGITAAHASQRWPQLTVKTLPKMLLSRCEWGHDDYSLNVANLPMAVPEPVPPLSPPLYREGRGSKAGQAGATPDLFGDGGAHSA